MGFARRNRVSCADHERRGGAMTQRATAGTTITIGSFFCGPDGSGNGGYTCGRAAHTIGDRARVTLHAPPPLDEPLRVDRHDGGVRLWDGDTLVADAVAWSAPVEAPPPVELDTAVRVATDPATAVWHPFPRCFVCGPRRTDGLGIYPGRAANRLLAAPWTPGEDLADEDGLVATPYLWAALDCPSGWAVQTVVPPGTVSVLGRLTAVVHERPAPGTPCVVVSRPDDRDGRKSHASTAVYTAGGRLLAAAAAIWISIP
jgi:hypothetical protein